MPRKTLHAEKIIATDTIELGGSELFITDVVINNAPDGDVQLTMTTGVDWSSMTFTASLPKYWPTTIRRK